MNQTNFVLKPFLKRISIYSLIFASSCILFCFERQSFCFQPALLVTKAITEGKSRHQSGLDHSKLSIIIKIQHQNKKLTRKTEIARARVFSQNSHFHSLVLQLRVILFSFKDKGVPRLLGNSYRSIII